LADLIANHYQTKENEMKKRVKRRDVVRNFIFCLLMVGLMAILSTPVAATDKAEEEVLVDQALTTFNQFMANKDMDYLKAHLKDCKGIIIVPSLIKGGFVFGGSGGHGVLLVRDEKTGAWSEPAFYTIGAVSFGLLGGIQKSEVILLVRTERGLESLYTSSFKLGGDVSIATGPVGIGASARGVTADMLSFAISEGVYGGLSLDGSVIGTRDKANYAYYGEPVRPVEIIVAHKVKNPQADKLRDALEKAEKSQ
jgi:lipid-binding SYLF domain-containing protein